MSDAKSRLLRTLKNLALALLNATLLLSLLCLIFYFMAARKMDGIARSFAEGLVTISPVKDELAQMNDALTALGADIAALRDRGDTANSAALIAVQKQLETLNETAEGFRAPLAAIADRPEQLIDQAIQSAANELKTAVFEWRNCPTPS